MTAAHRGRPSEEEPGTPGRRRGRVPRWVPAWARRGGRFRRLKATLLALGVVLLAVLPALPLLAVQVLETTGYSFAEEVLEGTRRSVDNLDEAEVGTPFNVLVVGSDSRAGLEDEDFAGAGMEAGGRADTIMVAHVSPERHEIVLLSIPRDLYVEDAGGDGGRINRAYANGPGALVAAVQRLTGLRIHHFVGIDFAGFMEVVDRLGGVELCNDTGERLRDTDSGLDMPPGCHQMDGRDALAFVRARKIDNDYGRMARQQQFIGAVLDRVADRESLLNPTRLSQTAAAVSRHVRTDDALTARTAVDLVRRLGSVSTQDIDARIYPSDAPPPACSGCAAYVYARPEAYLLTRAIARDRPVLPPFGRAIDEDNRVAVDGIRVEVRDAGASTAQLERYRDDLELLELPVQDATTTPEPLSSGAVLAYPQPLARQAALIADFLGEGVQTQPAPADAASDTLVLTVGPRTGTPGPQAAP